MFLHEYQPLYNFEPIFIKHVYISGIMHIECNTEMLMCFLLCRAYQLASLASQSHYKFGDIEQE